MEHKWSIIGIYHGMYMGCKWNIPHGNQTRRAGTSPIHFDKTSGFWASVL